MVTWSIKREKLLVGLIFLISYEKLSCVTKRIGYDINVMRQSVCLVINPLTVDSCASLFNCRPIGRVSDSMMGPRQSLLIYLSSLGLDLVLSVARSFGDQLVVFFCSGISVVLFHTLEFSGCHDTFLSSPHLGLIIGHIRDLFVPYDDSFMG